MNFATVRFTMGALDVRRTLYAHFEVLEPLLRGEPIYLVSCRTCMRQIGHVARVEGEIEAGPVLVLLEHERSHDRDRERQLS